LISSNKLEISTNTSLLLNRIFQFYIDQLNGYPTLIANFQQQLNESQRKYETLLHDKNVYEKEFKLLTQKNEQLNTEIQKLKEKNINLTSEYQQRDITIEKLEDDLAVASNKIIQLTHLSNNLQNEIALKENSLTKRNQEVLAQLKTIEDNSKKIKEYSDGDTGYLKLYKEHQMKNTQLEKTIEELNKHIYNLEHIPKRDISVDTSDLSMTNPKKKKKGIPVNDSNSSIKTQSQILRMPNKSSKSVRSFTQNVSTQNVSTQHDIILVNVETQLETENPNQPETENPNRPEVETKLNTEEEAQTPRELTLTEKAALIGITVNLIDFIIPIMNKLPDSPIQTNLTRLTKCSDSLVNKGNRSFVWGISLFHTFLMDTFLQRADFNKDIKTTEDLFILWIENQYSLPHIVNQIVGDFSIFLSQYHGLDDFCNFIVEILDGRFTINQISFISIIYSFAISIANPSVIKQLQNPNLDINREEVFISVENAYILMSKCFNEEIANSYISLRDQPISLVEFLRSSAFFFLQQHILLHQSLTHLLFLIFPYNLDYINLESFSNYLHFLNQTGDMNQLFNDIPHKEPYCMDFQTLFRYCISKKEIFLDILSMKSLSETVETVKAYSNDMNDLYYFLISKYIQILTYVLKRVSSSMLESLKVKLKPLRTHLLVADLSSSLFSYKQILHEVERDLLDIRGMIPFHADQSTEEFKLLKEYITLSEKVAFSLLDEHR
jgi:hypothetical protein